MPYNTVAWQMLYAWQRFNGELPDKQNWRHAVEVQMSLSGHALNHDVK